MSQVRVEQVARQQFQQRSPQYADNPMILNFFEQQVGQQLVQQQVLLQEAAKLGIRATDDDVRTYLHTGPTGEVLFPNGKYIGDDQYAALISERLNMSVKDFEDSVKTDIVVRRLQALIAGGVTVSDQEVRDAYRKANIKIKFDYAVISSDDLRKTINPSDSDLEAFFKKNAARYASPCLKSARSPTSPSRPARFPAACRSPRSSRFSSTSPLISPSTRFPSRRARATSSSQCLLAPTPRPMRRQRPRPRAFSSSSRPVETGLTWPRRTLTIPAAKIPEASSALRSAANMVPEFDNAIFTQKIGDIGLIKSQFGYHIVQVEERTTAHAQSLAEVQSTFRPHFFARARRKPKTTTPRRSPLKPSRMASTRPPPPITLIWSPRHWSALRA